MEKQEEFMRIAIEEARKASWPFGAVIVCDGEVVSHAGSGDDYDPTAHAEVNAIRKACKKLKVSSLKNCEMYTSCEPCALCIGALWYAGIRKIIFGSSLQEAAEVGKKIWGEDLSFPYESAKWPKGEKIEIVGGILRDEVMEVYKNSSRIKK